MESRLRVDVLLHRLRLTRSRNEAKTACEVGAVLVDGTAVRASQGIAPGDRLTVRFPHRTLEFELLETPGKSVSKQAARELYRIVRDEAAHRDA
jgi:ribosomal 50S subunit-recycling heat shock protein